MSTTASDMLGQPLTDVEASVLALYEQTKSILQRDDLAPCVRHNLVQSLAALAQVVNDLDLRLEHLYDLGA